MMPLNTFLSSTRSLPPVPWETPVLDKGLHQGQNSSPEEENSDLEDGRVKGGGTTVVMNSHATSAPQLEKERLDFGPIRYSLLLSWTVSLRRRGGMQDEIPCPASILRILSLSYP